MMNGGYAYEVEVAFDVPETYKKFTSAHTYDEQFYKGVYEMEIDKQIIFTNESEALQHATDVLRAIFEKFL